MAENSAKAIKRIKGMRDVLPQEFNARREAWHTIESDFRRYGYQGIEVPHLEDVDLHLRKLGESIQRNMYMFKDLGNENVCLRPELTASVVRMYNNNLTQEPLPLRLYYCGSSFRYDSPQKGRFREFTQAGIEVIGGKGPEYDAEVVALACDVMNSLSIQDYEVVIGSIGLVWDLLKQENIEERASSFIIAQLEELGKADDDSTGIDQMKIGLEKLGISFGHFSPEDRELVEAVKRLPRTETKKLLAWLMEKVFVNAAASRNFKEVAENLLLQVSREEQGPKINRILRFIHQLRELSGTPKDIFPRAEKLVKEYDIDASPLHELKKISEYLEAYGVNWKRTKMDFGFGRGLQYYTGMIFEIHCPGLEAASQVCGGGRYDALVRDLGGGTSVPALGFSFGLERLRLAMKDQPRASIIQVFVAPIGDQKVYQRAIQIASAVRETGTTCEIGPLGASPGDQLGMANRLGTKYTLLIGEDEIKSNTISVKDMNTGKQTSEELQLAIDRIREGRI